MDKEDKARLLEIVDSASQHARRIFYLYIGFLTYCILTVASTTDRQLALPGEQALLPILNIGVPLQGFFLYAPLIAIFLFVYFMVYLVRLKSLVVLLGKDFNKRLLFPWMFNIAEDPDKEYGGVAILQRYITSFSLWFTLPITLFIFAGKYVKKHEEYWAYVFVALPFISMLIVFWFWNKLRDYEYDDLIKYAASSILVYITVFWLALILVPNINAGKIKWANLDLENEILVVVPEKEKDFKQAYWVNFKDVNMNGANLYNSVLKRANFDNASLRFADLSSSNLQGANFNLADLRDSKLVAANLQDIYSRETNLEGADLSYVDLKNTDLWAVNLVGADLRGADLQETTFGGILIDDKNNIKSSDLRDARLAGAMLKGTSFNFADLKNSMLASADLEDSDLSDTNLEGAYLSNANLKGAYLYSAILKDAYLRDTNLDNAILQGANLEGALHVTVSQLCQSQTLFNAKMDSDILRGIKDKKTGCPELLNKPDY